MEEENKEIIKNVKVSKGAFKKVIKRLGKIIRKGLSIGATVVVVSASGVAIHWATIRGQISDISYNKKDIAEIIEYYKEKDDLTIVAMNDSQGLNINMYFWEPTFPEYVKKALTTKEIKPYLLNTASLKYNKTKHIDEMLLGNYTVEQIKMNQREGAYSTLSTISEEQKYPFNLGFLSYYFTQSVKNGDSDIRISDLITVSDEPIILYFSGGNDLMSILKGSPVTIKKYDENGNITEGYNYAVEKANDEKTITTVIKRIENNFINIYSLNENAKIYALSLYMPQNMDDPDYKVFDNLVENFNLQLKELCEKYGAVYMSNEKLGNMYSKRFGDFHINEMGHKVLAIEVLEYIASDIRSRKEKLEDETIYNRNEEKHLLKLR